MSNSNQKKLCTPESCPFASNDGQKRGMTSWGMGPEGWESARLRHQNHCEHSNKCADCGKELNL